jgi:PmbA protein
MLDPAAAARLAQQLVDRGLAAGASAADATYAGQRSLGVEVRLGALEDVNRSESESLNLRLFDGQRSATVATNDVTEESIKLLVERCMAMAREAPEDPYSGLADAELLETAPPVIDLGEDIEPRPEDLRERALDAERAALAVAGVTNSDGAGASASGNVLALATSTGFCGAYARTGHGCSASVIAGEGGTMQRDSAWHSVRHLGDLDAASVIGELAGQRTVARLNPARVKPGLYPILFDPRVSAGLLSHFASAINGSQVARKTSFLRDRLGEQIFAVGVSIVDDPLRPRGLRSHPFDGEGLSVARRELIADGRLAQWMASSTAARQLGIAPTGHAARGGGGAPGVSPSNLFMTAGKRSRHELLAAFPEAVLVTELIGQGVNPVTGDYSRRAAGFMVRGGEIAEPVSEFTIASNLIDMFAALEPGSDLELRKGIDAPTILVPEMTVGRA